MPAAGLLLRGQRAPLACPCRARSRAAAAALSFLPAPCPPRIAQGSRPPSRLPTRVSKSLGPGVPSGSGEGRRGPAGRSAAPAARRAGAGAVPAAARLPRAGRRAGSKGNRAGPGHRAGRGAPCSAGAGGASAPPWRPWELGPCSEPVRGEGGAVRPGMRPGRTRRAGQRLQGGRAAGRGGGRGRSVGSGGMSPLQRGRGPCSDLLAASTGAEGTCDVRPPPLQQGPGRGLRCAPVQPGPAGSLTLQAPGRGWPALGLSPPGHGSPGKLGSLIVVFLFSFRGSGVRRGF